MTCFADKLSGFHCRRNQRAAEQVSPYRYLRLPMPAARAPSCRLPSTPPEPSSHAGSQLGARWLHEYKMPAYGLELGPTAACLRAASPFSCALAHHQADAHRWPPLQCARPAGENAATGEDTNSQGLRACLWAKIRPCLQSPAGQPHPPAVRLPALGPETYQQSVL